MMNMRVVWLKRVATAVPLAALCLAVNSASGTSSFISAQSADWLAPHAASPSAGSALGNSATDEPASVTDAARASASQVSATPVSVGNGAIPEVALRAYQRAAVIIAESDPSCGLQWELLAAIGRIESDHGRFGGSSLNKAGVATPAIVGMPLNGKRGTLRILDTDAGLLDGDQKHDRAVGPMQFIPSTWSVVGVDADGDGRRDPQDIDDAALAAAVHLCGGAEDLATDAGLRAAVLRYNRSSTYADQVIALQEKYLAGKYNATPSTVPVSARPDPSGTSTAPHTDAATQDPKSDSGTPKRDSEADTGMAPKERRDGVDTKRPKKPKKPGKDPFENSPPPEDPDEDCLPEDEQQPEGGQPEDGTQPEDGVDPKPDPETPTDGVTEDETQPPAEDDETCPVDDPEQDDSKPGEKPSGTDTTSPNLTARP